MLYTSHDTLSPLLQYITPMEGSMLFLVIWTLIATRASREPGALGPRRTTISPCLRAASIEVQHNGADHNAIMVSSKQCYCNKPQQGSRSKNYHFFLLRKKQIFSNNVQKTFEIDLPCAQSLQVSISVRYDLIFIAKH